MVPMNNQMFSGITWMQLLHIIHQFLKEQQNHSDSCHEIERDYAMYFDMEYFKALINGGEWEKLEHYLTGFTTFKRNDVSRRLFFQIRKQKYLEALDRGDVVCANAILHADLSVILAADHPLFYELHSLQFSANFRNDSRLRAWVDVPTSRNIMVQQLPKLVRENPDLNEKLVMPQVPGRLVDLARQSLETQFSKCNCPRDSCSLLKDHQCLQQTAPALPADQTSLQDLSPSAPRRSRRDPQLDATLPVGSGRSNEVARRRPSIRRMSSGRRINRCSATIRRYGGAASRGTSACKKSARASGSRCSQQATQSLILGRTSSSRCASVATSDCSGRATARRSSTEGVPRHPTVKKVSVTRPLSAKRADASTDRQTSPMSNPVQASTSRHPKRSRTSVIRAPSPPPNVVSASGSLDVAVYTAAPSPFVTCSPSISALNDHEAGPSSTRDNGECRKRKRAQLGENSAQPQQAHPPLDSNLSLEAGLIKPASEPFIRLLEPSDIKTLVLPSIPSAGKICKLMFTESGRRLITLAESSEHCIWQWDPPASFREMPSLVVPSEDIKLINHHAVDDQAPEPSHCFILVNQETVMLSASRGIINFYDVVQHKKMSSYIEDSATSLAINPLMANRLAVGADDSRIVILRVDNGKVEHSFEDAHQGRVTSLVFSKSGEMLLSAGTDMKLILWDLTKWSKENSVSLPKLGTINKDVRVMLHEDGQFLAVHESLLAIFDFLTLQCLMKWDLQMGGGALTDATFSSDSGRVFAGDVDGTIWVFDAATLLPCWRLTPEAYQTSTLLKKDKLVYPTALLAHPKDKDQVAVGMSDGNVILLESSSSDIDAAQTLCNLLSASKRTLYR